MGKNGTLVWIDLAAALSSINIKRFLFLSAGTQYRNTCKPILKEF